MSVGGGGKKEERDIGKEKPSSAISLLPTFQKLLPHSQGCIPGFIVHFKLGYISAVAFNWVIIKNHEQVEFSPRKCSGVQLESDHASLSFHVLPGAAQWRGERS